MSSSTRTGPLTSDALQQLQLPVRLPAGRLRPLVAAAGQALAARVPDRRLVVLLRLVGLALPADPARLDPGRLRRRPVDRGHRRRAPPPRLPRRLARDERRHPRLLQVRRLLRALAE